MSLEQINRLIGGDTGKRVKDDFYATPLSATHDILNRVTFDGEIWEPACGDGAISSALKLWGYQDVYSTDLVDRGYGDDHFDFLKSYRGTNNIITNPPFNISTKFVLHALDRVTDKVVIFNKLTFLEGQTRRKLLFSRYNLEKVYIYSARVGFQNRSGMLAFAWYVFDKKYHGLPQLEWI